MEQRGWFVGTQYGPTAHADRPDREVASTVQVAFYDATNPEARDFVWSRVRDNYLTPYGITAFWLDACEPELKPGFQENLRYWAGPGLEVGNLYPAENGRPAPGGDPAPEGSGAEVPPDDENGRSPRTVGCGRSVPDLSVAGQSARPVRTRTRS